MSLVLNAATLGKKLKKLHSIMQLLRLNELSLISFILNKMTEAMSLYHYVFKLFLQMYKQARGYKTFLMLNSTEHEIFPAHKC